MFTLKLYQSGNEPGVPSRTVIVQTAGLWVDACDNGVKHVRAFLKEVGVMDEGGTPEFYVGGAWPRPGIGSGSTEPQVIRNDNYFEWGVLENALGKTTEMLR